MIKEYNSYQETQGFWIKKIPSNWKFGKLKHFAEILSGYAFKSTDYVPKDGVPIIRIGDIKPIIDPTYAKRANPRNIKELERFIIKRGDLLLAMTGATIGKSSSYDSNEVAYLNQRVGSLRAIQGNSQNFLKYFILSDFFNEFIRLECDGAAQENISSSDIAELEICFPSPLEQTQIARYLDHKTGLIDNIIAQKEQLIEKLKEQRQAIINEAVTKGLNPDAPLKDSGIEWLGKIPEHWEATSIKNILSIPITDGPHTTPEFLDDGVPFISAESIRNHKIDFNNKRGYISEEDYELYSKKYIPEINDIYMVKSGATTGNIAIVDTEAKFTIWSPLAVFRANPEKLFYEYLFFVLQSKFFKYQVELNWSYGTQQNIGMGVLSNLKIVFPKDILEQKNIVKQIKVSTIKSDASIESINDSIKKLKEYRQSIISEAVTGKIDVRDWEKNKI